MKTNFIGLRGLVAAAKVTFAVAVLIAFFWLLEESYKPDYMVPASVEARTFETSSP